MAEPNNTIYTWMQSLYPELKFWSFFTSGLWVVYKVVDWFKTLKTNHLNHIQLGINEIGADIKEIGPQLEKALDKQTTVMVDSIGGLREDIRMLTTAIVAQSEPKRHYENQERTG